MHAQRVAVVFGGVVEKTRIFGFFLALVLLRSHESYEYNQLISPQVAHSQESPSVILRQQSVSPLTWFMLLRQ
jgi:hypothetical protein